MPFTTALIVNAVWRHESGSASLPIIRLGADVPTR
jgi:hypothetical protein